MGILRIIEGFNMGFLNFLQILIILFISRISCAQNGDRGSDEALARCNLDLSTFIPLPYSDTSNMVCKTVWNSYVLQHTQSKDDVVTIVLSASYTIGWVGIGFSRNGMMLNSSAMVGWISKEGKANIKQYYLKGFEQLDVVPNEGDLPLTNVPPFVSLRGGLIYIAFQLNFGSRVSKQPILLAFGTRYPTKHHHLYAHDDKISILMDFSSGLSDTSKGSVSVAPANVNSLTRNHGILGLLSWGLFLPFGVISARYFKHHDPLWYYLHVGIQFLGFLLGLAGVVVGFSLYNKMHAHFPNHRGIGIFILVLSVLQILAFFVRPDRGNKIRKYWNWYHHWFGRITLVVGNVNILLGIKIGAAGNEWKVGYGFVLGTTLIASIILEVLSKIRSRRKDVPPAFPMNSFQ